MVRVESIGAIDAVRNPRNGEFQNKRNVIFVEDGKRGGLNAALSGSSGALSKVLGMETGIQLSRTHTEPMNPEAAAKLTVGQEIPELFINRILTSFPQMGQQENVAPRMVGNKPTFVATVLAPTEESDVDDRIDNGTLAVVKPEYFAMAQASSTTVLKGIDANEATARQERSASLVSSGLGGNNAANAGS